MIYFRNIYKCNMIQGQNINLAIEPTEIAKVYNYMIQVNRAPKVKVKLIFLLVVIVTGQPL